MATFEDRKRNVTDFMKSINDKDEMKKQDEAFKNSTFYKLKKLDSEADKARNDCLNIVIVKAYKDALPLNDDYKAAYKNDIDAAFKDFLAQRCPKGIEYYIKEGLKKKSPFAKKVLEAVNELVDDQLKDKGLNIEDTKTDDIAFDPNEDVQRRINVIGDDLNIPDISEQIKSNVLNTAKSEITRAKEKKAEIKDLETTLANDINMNTKEAVDDYLLLHGYTENKFYEPTFFEAIMINKMNKYQAMYESGDLPTKFTYHTLNMYGKENDNNIASQGDLALIETVQDYTAWSLLKALKLESVDIYRLKDLIYDYTSTKY